MLKISLIGSLDENDENWAIYKIHDAHTLEVIFIAHCKLNDVFRVPEIRGIPTFDRKRKIVIDVVGIYKSGADAKVEASKLVNQYNRPYFNRIQETVRHCPVICNETGQRWSSAAECAREQGINVGNLSNHLNNRPGNKTIKGLTYSRVSMSPAKLKKEAEESDELPWCATGIPETGETTIWQGVSNSKYVIASGSRKNVIEITYEWLLKNAPHRASGFAADWGIY